MELEGGRAKDLRNSNGLAGGGVGLDEEHAGSRRWACGLRADGPPRKLVHRIEAGALDAIPGQSRVYLAWQEFEAGLAWLLEGLDTVATEYAPRAGNPYVSRIDAGTIELIGESGCKIISSGDLVQRFEATWDEAQAAMHREAEAITTSAFGVAWQAIADATSGGGQVQETAIQQVIMDHYRAHNATTYHPPIVRSEEHTSELQSLVNLVCRLLLEKKKQ